jgi:putative sigma-54 modulation protein
MHVEFVGKGITIPDNIRSFTEKKLAKVTKFLDEPIEARLLVEPDKHGLAVDLHIAHRHGVVQAEEEAAVRFEDGINAVVTKTEKQARRSRKRFIDVRRRADRHGAHQQWPVEVLDGPSLKEERTSRVIKVHHLAIKPMDVDEAALALEDAKNDFVVYRDTNSQAVNVLYRRRDGNFGLIAPDF